MDEIDSKYRFRFVVDPNGRLAKYPYLPWSVGSPGNKISIQLFNQHAGVPHRVRMIGWGHKESGTPLDSLTGTKEWEAQGSASTPAAVHTVQNHPGRYGFKIEFDGVEEDAEIIVDPPPTSRPRGKAKGARAKVGSAARRTAGKAAKRPAEKAKPGKAKKAKPGKAKKAARKSAAPGAKAKSSRKRGARRR